MRNYIIIFFVTFSANTFAQLRQDQWLIGGNGLFSYSKSKELEFISVQLSPAAGYFFKDKFAGGLRSGLTSDTYKPVGDKYRNSTISVGPFLRYYFLPLEKKVNLFADAAFGYSWTTEKNFAFSHSHKYSSYNLSVMAGPSVFLNERTALEITIGYTYLSRGPYDTTITNKIQIGVGLQVHLGKR